VRVLPADGGLAARVHFEPPWTPAYGR